LIFCKGRQKIAPPKLLPAKTRPAFCQVFWGVNKTMARRPEFAAPEFAA
jgi:hypothetical protein